MGYISVKELAENGNYQSGGYRSSARMGALTVFSGLVVLG